MKILEKLTKKITSSASIAVTDSVKTEAKKVANEASPVIFGVGMVAIGLVIFKMVSGKESAHVPFGPTASRMDITTNNYFFDSSASAEFIRRVMHED